MSEEETKLTLLGVLVAQFIMIFFGVMNLLFTAHVVVDIWSWWMVPVGLPRLWFWTAVGADLIFALFYGMKPTPDRERAEIQEIENATNSDAGYVMRLGWWSFKKNFLYAFWALTTWGIAAALHKWVE